MRTSGTLYYLLADHLGGTALTTSEQGLLVSRMKETKLIQAASS